MAEHARKGVRTFALNATQTCIRIWAWLKEGLMYTKRASLRGELRYRRAK